jgi:pSer/pThr/pTyr-binding forkhead associated (FHA) protein
VPGSPLDPHGASPTELQERIAADREGNPYLLLRDGDGAQRIVPLLGVERLTVGRAPGCELELTWDNKVSGAHAQLERLGASDWTVIDDGLSRNGSFVNGERLRQRRRLADRDVMRFGDTAVVFRAPVQAITATIPEAAADSAEVQLSPAQRRVLVALCRPFSNDEFATPASNQEIADELVVSVEAVKTHLRALFERFEIGDLPRQAKRGQLVKRAFQTGTITQRDLEA